MTLTLSAFFSSVIPTGRAWGFVWPARADLFASFVTVAGYMNAPNLGIPSIPTVVQFWAKVTDAASLASAKGASNAQITRYVDATGALVTEFTELLEAGHDWPIGVGTRYAASDEIWDFFQRVTPWPAL